MQSLSSENLSFNKWTQADIPDLLHRVKTSNLRENGRETFASIIYTAGEGSPGRKNVGEGTKEASLDELLLGTVVQCDGKSTGPGVRSLRI